MSGTLRGGPPPPDGPTPRPMNVLGAAAHYLRSSPWQAVGLVGLLVSLVTLAVALRASGRIHGWDELWRNGWHHLWGLAWLLLLTVRVRTVGLRQAVAMWLTGFFTVIALVMLTTEPLQRWLGNSAFVVGYWVPVLEEVFKAVPLVAFALLAGRQRGQKLAISDLVLLGYCVGAGFAVHEDALYGIARGVGPDGGGLYLLFPMSTGGFALVAGHAVWGAVIGLGVGVAMQLRRVPVVALAVVVGATGLAALDHGRGNLNALDSAPTLVELLVGTRGTRIMWLLLVGLVAAVVVDWWATRRASRALGNWPALRPTHVAAAVQASDDPLDAVVRVQGCLRYHRLRNRICHAVGRPWIPRPTVPRATVARLAVWGLLGGTVEHRLAEDRQPTAASE